MTDIVETGAGTVANGDQTSHLPNAAEMPKLFLDYVGMGDSDNPKDYAYSTAERADLVEAIWQDLGVQSTTVLAFDFRDQFPFLVGRQRRRSL